MSDASRKLDTGAGSSGQAIGNSKLQDSLLKLSRRIEAADQEAKQLRCNEHGLDFVDRESFDEHFKSTAHTQHYYCEMCLKEFKTEASMEQHMQSSVHDDRSFPCDKCTKVFNSEYSLNQHLAAFIHKPVNEYSVWECDICEKSFKDQNALNQHVQSSFHDPFVTCEECGKDFYSEERLNDHLRAGEHRLTDTCSTCKRKFADHAALYQHWKITGHMPYF